MTEKQMQEAAARLRAQATRLQGLLWLVEEWMNSADPQGVKIRSITVRPDKRQGVGTLVIVKGVFEGENLVAFSSGDTLETALVGALERIRNKSLEYRTDQPWGA